jgi:murein L,D-transpeptidase YcbB/YkuD
MSYKHITQYLSYFIGVCILVACGHKKPPKQQAIVKNIKQLHEAIPENIAERLAYMADNNGVMEDSVRAFSAALQFFYSQHHNAPQWSENGVASVNADTMLLLVQQAMDMGLLPVKYHEKALSAAMRQVKTDSNARKDAALWARIDVMMSDAFMKMASHLHFGVAPRDSITLRTDSVFTDLTLAGMLQQALQQKNIGETLHNLEPPHTAYQALKQQLLTLREKYQGLKWDTLPEAYTDTAAFKQRLLNRLVQGAYVDTAGRAGDTALLKDGIKAFQREFNLYPDGVAGKRTRQMLNRSLYDWQVQIALNLDRWRKMPDSLPQRYIMVNVPGYGMEVVDSGQVILRSRVIVGTPGTRTPLLNSRMTNFMMFPYWRVPYSIVFKEMLPAIRKNVNYLAEKNLEVIDRHGEAVDPYSIDWSKLHKGYFPYVLRQMDGEDNSLGIMKFNFMNKYSVYLHDTNNRNLFKNSYRALSHGCVRVQQWDSLAMYLVKDDTLRNMRDSVRLWLALQEKKQVTLTRRIPIYIRYFSAAVQDEQLLFYEDIYGEDRRLRKKIGY